MSPASVARAVLVSWCAKVLLGRDTRAARGLVT